MGGHKSLSDNPKKLTMFSLFGLAIGIGALLAGGAQAMMTTSPDGSGSSNLVQPYTGGAPVSKVFYPSDGSTVTVTSTGAVIKQSPGHTPYREGWVNPSNIGGINAASDLKGQLASGNKNPYTNNNQPKPSSNPPSSNQNNQQSSQTNNNQNTQPTNTNTNSNTNTNTNTSTSSPSASANATANATVNLTGSTPTPAATSNQTNVQTPAAQTSTSATTSAAQAPARSQSSSNFSGKSLPNTGPGDVLAISGIATILGTVGHFIFQRLRFRSLA